VDVVPPDIRVLVVDDYAEMRALILLAFNIAGGFEVVAEAGTADEAIREAERARPDAVVLDVLLPGRSGPAALSEIVAAAGKQCAVVLLTALSEDSDLLADAKAAGVPIHSKAHLPRLPDVVRSLITSSGSGH
jgi:two-component system NarL family response regulator